MFKPFRLLLLFSVAFAAVDLPAAGQRHALQTVRDSGISIEVRPYFSDIALKGYTPVRVIIANHSGRDRDWALHTQDTLWGTRPAETRGEFIFSVPAGESRVFDILVPVGAVAQSATRSGFVSLQFSGHGIPIDQGRINLHRTFSGRGNFADPYAGMSRTLYARNWGNLTQLPRSIQGAAVNPDRLPGDWRGLSGFDIIWLTDDDWRRIGGIERRAMLDWLAVGGNLVIARDENDHTPAHLAGLPDETTAGDSVPYGYGRLHFIIRQSNEMDTGTVTDLLYSLNPSRYHVLGQRVFEGNWEQFRQVGLPSIPVVFFAVFLTVFAVLVGPFNLLVFAKPGRRHRLLWTTPLISLTAGSLVILIILFQDGTGGTGVRLAIWHHLPEANRAVLVQEQTSRTGMLIGSRFTISEPVVMNQLNLATGRTAAGSRFQLSGNHYHGDWFLSRSTQAQLLQSVPATRSRIELANPAAASNGTVPPQLSSTLPYAVDTVYYRDGRGTLWSGGPLNPGELLVLERDDPEEFVQWWNTQLNKASPLTRPSLQTQRNRTNYFYASADGAFSGPETLSVIRWTTQHSIHLGPLPHEP